MKSMAHASSRHVKSRKKLLELFYGKQRAYAPSGKRGQQDPTHARKRQEAAW